MPLTAVGQIIGADHAAVEGGDFHLLQKTAWMGEIEPDQFRFGDRFRLVPETALLQRGQKPVEVVIGVPVVAEFLRKTQVGQILFGGVFVHVAHDPVHERRMDAVSPPVTHMNHRPDAEIPPEQLTFDARNYFHAG